VLPEHRNSYLSSVLLRRGLTGAATWGFDTFTARTARPALQRRLERSGAAVTGRFAQMVSAASVFHGGDPIGPRTEHYFDSVVEVLADKGVRVALSD